MDAQDKAYSLEDITKENILAPGSNFARYKIIELLGAGGMGKVYKAQDLQTKRVIALKTLLNPGSQKAIERFTREAKVAANLKHPSIATLYDMGEHQGICYLTMEYIEGNSYKELIYSKNWSTKKLVKTVQKVAIAVAYAHNQNVIHRDLKPSNIMIDSDLNPCVIDFGLAKFTNQFSKNLTKTGAIVGTLHYMPPEQVDGKKYEIDQQSDIYSLGAILYESIALKKPFEANSQRILIKKIILDSPLAPSKVNLGLPKTLDRICAKAMAKKKKQRYKTMEEFIEELEVFLQQKQSKTTPFPLYTIIFAIVVIGFFYISSQQKIAPKVKIQKQDKNDWIYEFATELKMPLDKVKELCYRCKNGKLILDMSEEKWKSLPFAQKQKYIQSYQKAYAKMLGFAPTVFFPLHKLQMEAVLVPPGRFIQGAKKAPYPLQNSYLDTAPIRKVVIDTAFFIGKYEVTVAQWKDVMKENPQNDLPQFPVTGTTRARYLEFCQMAKMDLPSESQWEYACRAGTTGNFHWGKGKASPYARIFTYETSPVGGKKANAFGLYDIIGNVWEWCKDNAHPTYKNAPLDGSPQNDPAAANIDFYIIRGVKYHTSTSIASSITRKKAHNTTVYKDIGFRIVKKIKTK